MEKAGDLSQWRSWEIVRFLHWRLCFSELNVTVPSWCDVGRKWLYIFYLDNNPSMLDKDWNAPFIGHGDED